MAKPAETIIELELSKIQKNLKAPKGQFNKFGNYSYRSLEDIVEAVKPLLPEGATLQFSDDIVLVGDRYYVRATAMFCLGGESIETTAYAREAFSKKGMDESQITGSASSYARKYAANALFAIDDTKDADTRDNSNQGQSRKPDEVSEKNELLVQIKKSMGVICQGLDTEQKKLALQNVAGTKDFNALGTKKVSELKSIAQKVGKMAAEKLKAEKDSDELSQIAERIS